MRQEGNQINSGNPNQVPNGPSSTAGGLLGDGSLSHQSPIDDLHHHIHSQNSQTLNFGDIY